MLIKAVLPFLVCASTGSSIDWTVTLYTRAYANGITDISRAIPTRPTVVIVHGWEQSANSTWVILAKDTHLSTADKNIVTLDWSKDSKTVDYPHAANAVPQVGAYLARQFLVWLELNLINLSTTRFVGFSLGAHVIGICGQKFQDLTGGWKLPYLIGLEPAAPLFEGKSIDERLDESDGSMVQVFHTSTTGIAERCGHVDVYFSYSKTTLIFIKTQNCAVDQPGCPADSGLPPDNLVFQTAFCNHVRATAYYIISITSSNFLAAPCTSCDQFKRNSCDISTPIVVGDQLNPTTEDGAYYLTTSSQQPFAEGTAGLKM